MDALAYNISSSCPAAFNSMGGDLFLRAVTAVVAAHCSIIGNNDWPPDKFEDIIKRSNDTISYDFIIVGAGTAGSLLASQLSVLNPSWSILLVEAGADSNVDSEVPAFLLLDNKSDNDWKYKTEPDGTNCLGFENTKCIWSKGKGMGGSSSINAMLYLRAHPNDFKDWDTSNSSGWSYEDLLPYFKTQEHKLNLTENIETTENKWYKVIEDSWKELGFSNISHSHEALSGVGKVKLLRNQGRRMNSAKVYLNESSTNLDIMKNTFVEKVVIDSDTKMAKGIQIRYKSGILKELKAQKEVILSSGSIGTPQILMQSGIGIKSHLTRIGIPCLLNLPVGQNLQDHLFFPLFLKSNSQTYIPSEAVYLFLLQYMLTRSGPFSTIGITDLVGFVDTNNFSDYPNIQFHHMHFPINDQIIIKQYLEGVGYKKEIVNSIKNLNTNYDLLSIHPTLLHPKSKGAIWLTDKFNINPKIVTNYLKHSDDMKALINAIRFVRKLENTAAFKSMELEIVDIKLTACSSHTFDSDEYWQCYIRHMATTIYHPVGTAKMGNDDNSVVDYNLLIHGMQNLRIVDASIMPSIPGANTLATTLAIAHKAVNLIRKQYRQNDEL